MSHDDALRSLGDRVAALRKERELLDAERTEALEGAEIASEDARCYAEARDVVTVVLGATQGEVIGFIENTVTLALETVFGNGHAFHLRQDVKRNQTELTPLVVIDGEEYSPRDELGCGVVDVVSFGLRLALWALKSPRSRATFVLDEPFRFVSKDRLEAVGRVLRETSARLGAQYVIVTHEAELAAAADKAWEVRKERGVSRVRELLVSAADAPGERFAPSPPRRRRAASRERT